LEHLPLMMNTSVIRFHSADRAILNDDYLYAFLRSPDFHGQVNAFVIGGAQPNFGPSHLKQMTIPVPSLRDQERIANVISSYDDLIENNRRRMALLEESARLLYQEWFIRLRFPGHEHVRFTNGLPEGWKQEFLGEVAEINQASLGGSFDGEIDYIDISAVTPGQINETTHYHFKEAPSRARRIVQHGDIIWSCVRPNRKSHAVIWRPSPNLIASTGFAVITPVRVPTSYLLQATTTPDFVGYLENHAKGAAYPAVVAGDFERAKLIIPPKSLLDALNDFGEPVIDQLHNLRQQSQKLRTARDLLLPRLMSGEISA
jgi:type I restriction enzyme, S subunit